MQLILNTFGASLRRKDGMFHVLSGKKEVTVSPRKVQSICATTGVHLSTDALRLALEHHIDVLLIDSRGDPYGRFWHGRLGSTTALRRRQLEVSMTEEGVALAREWVVGKLEQQAEYLKELARTRPDRAGELEGIAATIGRFAGDVKSAQGTSLDELRGTLMGLEGVAGREYFRGLSLALPERFRFRGRSRSPAEDEFNCLLNYAYGVLYGLVERSCLLVGLDPYIGLLHTDNYNKLSLVFDLIELFRNYAERVVVNLFASRQVTQDLFDQVARGNGQKKGGAASGYRLNEQGRALLLSSLNEYLDRVKHHGRRRLKIRDTVNYECQRLAGRLLRGLDDQTEIDLSVFDLAEETKDEPAATSEE